MNANPYPSHAPTVSEMLADRDVLQWLEQAWNDSLPNGPATRHEEGGWIYLELTTGRLIARRHAGGSQADLDLTNPPLLAGCVIVATFHTHPNPSADGWDPAPSPDDTDSANRLGVPCLSRADDGTHTTGPACRRAGTRDRI